MKNLGLVVFLVGSLLSTGSIAGSVKELQNVRFNDKVKVGNKTLSLNGMGVRKKKVLFIPVDVYVAALYLEKPMRDFQEALDSKQIKHVEMVFLRDVEASKIVESQNEEFEKNCKPHCEMLKPKAEFLNSLVTDVKK